jgi:SAM-dependent methyltransferase
MAGRMRRGLRIQPIDLTRALVGGEVTYGAETWAEIVGNMRRASMLLRDSVHVQFLEEYKRLGPALLEPGRLERTPYYRNAVVCVRHFGSYFGQSSRDGLHAQARAFVTLFDRVCRGDTTEVEFPPSPTHSGRYDVPRVQATLTPGTVSIMNGHHRLAALWAAGRRTGQAVVFPPAPSPLQALVLAVGQTRGRRELYQPIDSPEFDRSWNLVRRCTDRLGMMLDFLREGGRPTGSFLDIGCSYGWFVKQFADRGWDALGVDEDPRALKIGRIAYGLGADQLVQMDVDALDSMKGRRFDVVIFLSVLHHFVLNPDFGTPEALLAQVDRLTRSVLFFEMGQEHEAWWQTRLKGWDDEHVIDYIRKHTSFTTVIPLGKDQDSVPPYEQNYGRTLFACLRT